MCGWLSRIFVEKMRTFPEFGYRYRHKDCTYIILCVQNTTMTTWRRLQFNWVGHRRVRSLQGHREAVQTAITFLVASWPKSANAPADIMRTSGNTLWFGRCIEKISQYRRNRNRISVVCTECVQTWGNSHEGCDPGWVSITLAAIFGYVVGDICEHLLEKIGSISMARSSGTRLWTGGIAAG
jgi:hypothetical protein